MLDKPTMRKVYQQQTEQPIRGRALQTLPATLIQQVGIPQKDINLLFCI
jgi:hypothetical protein